MIKCSKCKVRIVRHLWLVNEDIYCSPRCERGKDSRYSDKVMEKIGMAGLKKNQPLED